MTDLNDLRAALLAAVPVDGNTIGNQSLLERVRGQIPQLTEDAFWAARDGLIEEGVLAKGRGRGGAVIRGVMFWLSSAMALHTTAHGLHVIEIVYVRACWKGWAGTSTGSGARIGSAIPSRKSLAP